MTDRADDRYVECPTACVECNNILPLNHDNICKVCWGEQGDDWEEEE